ncbi:MAG: hypothetical protein K6D03_01530 [Solobacterium sp.]|nr:hypothetical protein [Solobacterium sp.]
MNEKTVSLILLAVLPLIGAVSAWVRMHTAVYDSELPTEKKQINTLYAMAGVSVAAGIIQALLYTSLVKEVPEYGTAVCAACGIAGLAASFIIGTICAPELKKGFMDAPEAYSMCLRKSGYIIIIPIIMCLVFMFAMHIF